MFQKTMAFTLKFTQHNTQQQAELLSLVGWGQPDRMALLPMVVSLFSGPAGQLGHVLPWAMADTHGGDNRKTRTGSHLLSKSTYPQSQGESDGPVCF